MIGVRKQEPKKGAPAYIVSFSALMTILLTFFILLCTMANEQEAGLMAAGTGSFIHNINALGLPGLLPGHRPAMDLGAGRTQFAVPPRALESEKESDADLLYRRVIEIEPLHLPAALAEHFKKQEELRIPLNVKFEPGSARLTEESAGYLWPMVARVRAVPYHLRIEVNVNQTFICNGEFASAWQLSAARAAAIVRYFQQAGGISFKRMIPSGLGSARPLVKNPTISSVNDRAELVILKY